MNIRDLITFRKRIVWMMGVFCILFAVIPYLPIQLTEFSVLYLVPISFLTLMLSLFVVEIIIFYRQYNEYSAKYRVVTAAISFVVFTVVGFVFSLIKDIIAASEGYKYLYAEYPAYSKLDDAFTILTSFCAVMVLYYLFNLIIRSIITGFTDLLALEPWKWAYLTLDDSISKIFALAVSFALLFISLIPIKYIPHLAVKLHGQELFCDSEKQTILLKSSEGKFLVVKNKGNDQLQFVFVPCKKLTSN